MSYYLLGFAVSLGLFMTLGAQNIHIIKHGLKRDRWQLAAAICYLCDLFSVSLGVFGVGDFLSTNVVLAKIVTAGGVVFLIWYGTKTFLEMRVDKTVSVAGTKSSIKAVVATSFAVTLLNPHVYVDTLVILGGMSTSMIFSSKVIFWAGISSASLIWMFFIGALAAKISPLMKKPITWKIMEGISGTVLYGMAIYLVISFFKL